jgi:hypothetical protein
MNAPGLLGLMAAAALYMIPTAMAYQRHHLNRVPIALVNVVAGWTLVGWLFALVWSLSSNVASVVRNDRMYWRDQQRDQDQDKAREFARRVDPARTLQLEITGRHGDVLLSSPGTGWQGGRDLARRFTHKEDAFNRAALMARAGGFDRLLVFTDSSYKPGRGVDLGGIELSVCDTTTIVGKAVLAMLTRRDSD